jgi:NADPH:quinone reductase-like Zn-dependent oxidoreductase
MGPQPPKTMKAIKVHDSTAKVTSEVSVPKLRPTYLLAKVEAIALNPTDWKHVSGKRAAPDCTSGCDFAGTVVEVGDNVSKDLKPGDRIAATTHGANASQTEDGCFAEYCVAKADLVVKIPDGLSFEDAATAPLGVGTVVSGHEEMI